MKNKRPVFLLGFARGGSNLLLNILRSHPELCSPRGELQEVFKGKNNEPIFARFSKLVTYSPILIKEGYDIFRLGNWNPRHGLSSFTKNSIDSVLFKDKLKARMPSQNKYKSEDTPYTEKEIESSRLLVKYLNGLIFLTEHFIEMYPEARFVALVRNPLAVVEGHVRRGMDLATFSSNYEKGAKQIIMDSQKYHNYRVYRYEDLIMDSDKVVRDIYQFIGLDIDRVDKIRFQTKNVIGKSGGYDKTIGKKLIWYSWSDYNMHFVKDANMNQINNLTPEQQGQIRQVCESSMKFFDY